jgi:hypothetical protein
MMNIGMALFLLITSIVLTVPALAQGPVAVNKIRIELTGVDCTRASQVFVIAGGADGDPHRATRETPDGCHWTYERDGQPFHVSQTRFSRRLRGVRTRCRYAVLANDREEGRKKIGSLEFGYPLDDAVDLTITTAPPKFDLTYSRKLSADKRNKRDKQNVDCNEGDIGQKQGMAKLNDVWLSEETLNLTIAWTDKPADAKLVTLDTRLRNRIIADAEKKRATELRPDDFGMTEVDKVSQQKTGKSPPHVAPNQREGVGEVLRKKGLKGVQVKAE